MNTRQEAPTIEWRGSTYAIPDMETVEDWIFGETCETPDGQTVEHDHPDGWLRLIGVC